MSQLEGSMSMEKDGAVTWSIVIRAMRNFISVLQGHIHSSGGHSQEMTAPCAFSHDSESMEASSHSRIQRHLVLFFWFFPPGPEGSLDDLIFWTNGGLGFSSLAGLLHGIANYIYENPTLLDLSLQGILTIDLQAEVPAANFCTNAKDSSLSSKIVICPHHLVCAALRVDGVGTSAFVEAAEAVRIFSACFARGSVPPLHEWVDVPRNDGTYPSHLEWSSDCNDALRKTTKLTELTLVLPEALNAANESSRFSRVTAAWRSYISALRKEPYPSSQLCFSQASTCPPCHSRFLYLLSPDMRLREAAIIWDDVGGDVRDTKKRIEILSRSVTAETSLTFISNVWDHTLLTTLAEHVHHVNALTFAKSAMHGQRMRVAAEMVVPNFKSIGRFSLTRLLRSGISVETYPGFKRVITRISS
ncbi:hypothetical protein PAXINDRAFT_14274 [Paxillus involutus ATCC 200175]|uniref:Uncharacterized protein n=1 Tax=Paxillus involutus ATCC 200175 TaxID=664439 RepID=A0A0C9SUQ2_PAXIN|nr:hypothetical protein PAXINDRAFT_14274 [Paxillus involutus ATCC 200175]